MAGEVGADVTRELAAYACGSGVADPPDAVVDLALRSLVDTVGVLIAARHDPAVRIVSDAAPGGGPDPKSTVLFEGRRTDAASAALLNGTAAHAVDFDLGGMFQGHPASVLWPAVLAVGEQVSASGQQLIEAIVVGYGVSAAVAAGMDMRAHYGNWHATSTISIFGAAAAAGRLLGLTVGQMRCALGLVGSMASGSRQNFGSMTKALHAGLAARDGVLAAQLAARGFTADPAQLESPLGFYAVYGDTVYLDRVGASLSEPWTLTSLGLGIKRYPCCYSSHRAITAALRLASEAPGLASEAPANPAGIEKITVTVEPNGLESLIQHHPTTEAAGRFSVEYVVAAALLDRSIGLASFTDEAVCRPEVQRLIAATQVVESAVPPVGPALWEGPYYAVVDVAANGTTRTQRVDMLDDRMTAVSRGEIEAKFSGCVAFANWPELDAGELLAELWSLANTDVFTGFAALRQPAPVPIRS